MKEKDKKEKIDEIRRKLLKIGVWAVPVIITFSSRKVWAGTPFPGGKGKEEKLFEEDKREF